MYSKLPRNEVLNILNSFPSSEEILTPEFLEKYKGKQPQWGFDGLGYVVYKRTYARNKPDGTKEEWYETVERCVRGGQAIGACWTKEEAERLYDHVFNLRCNFAGRSLWQLGTDKVNRFQANSLINCFYTNIEEIEDFCFVFENLMLGCGVGFSVRKEHVHQLPKLAKISPVITHELTKDADYIVPDSREGWVELLRKVLTAYFVTGKGFTYSTILVRGYGEPIKTFGGTASGPGILIEGITNICKVMDGRLGKKLRSIDALDICNIVASIVVAGNVRRSSQIALGDADDMLFLRAKRWDTGTIPNWRAMSNNTICADNYDYTSNEFWKGYDGNGEPYGLFNLELSKINGRLGEIIKDDGVVGTNPCSEISLESGESCNLAEIYLNNIQSEDQLKDCAMLLYKLQKAICSLEYIHNPTNEVVHKNFRLGLGVTGICQSANKVDWLDSTYKELRKFDEKWSKYRGWPSSIKLTTIKPSGSLSLLAGSTPGVHPAYSKYYIRRVRMSSMDPLLASCRESGYTVEYVKNFDGTYDHKTCVVEFICKCENAVLAKEMTAIDQLELVKLMQTKWADNAVSVTVYYKDEELPEIKKWLKENYENSIKCVSFLRHSDHGFDQAPYEEITEQEYVSRLKKIKTFDNKDMGNDLLDNMECANGVCPVR